MPQSSPFIQFKEKFNNYFKNMSGKNTGLTPNQLRRATEMLNKKMKALNNTGMIAKRTERREKKQNNNTISSNFFNQ